MPQHPPLLSQGVLALCFCIWISCGCACRCPKATTGGIEGDLDLPCDSEVVLEVAGSATEGSLMSLEGVEGMFVSNVLFCIALWPSAD